ncbi:MocR-like pyridoxine biosynthesis transcription factor PdxR [Actinacidiphila glaucinigra]|uniref:GntR family transcriptional regulator / MocR family aminotransferase n=1 Tax=Actinacidiphila glaucinigra TaxID=235986 RepID=A0A239JKG0_9ACTN|nr:PLP-dependent aminotransferase family protein [Actinacidiphila glaucinigra]SNT05234.1 GntR family transcriptional regulator / MocR family aminotransferase [Actinacidiphila glaucinigra]
MSDSGTNSGDGRPPSAFGADLHLELRGTKLRTGLTDALREAVRTGRLAPGTRLPPSRTLAVDLGVSRNTVVEAYAELVAEGWLTAQQGSGTRVAPRAEPHGPPAGAPRTGPARTGPARTRPRYAMQPGAPDLARFPRTQWLAAARRALTAAPNDALGYGDPGGRPELRTALADYLARARGVYAEPERIVVCSGFHHGLALMAQVLRTRRVPAVAVEAYGLDLYRDLLTNAGLRTPPLYVDEHGARTEDLPRLRGAGAVLMTPAHQYPTGVALRPERRTAAVAWARDTGGLILEDDYDGEFRYDRQPVGALQGLDPQRVVYFGSASKSLAPGVRLGWMVLPDGMVPEIVEAKGYGDYMSSTLEQLTLAEFIVSGAYDRHVRSMRQRYRRRRDQLVAALAERAPRVRAVGMAAGLQVVLELPRGTEGSVVRAAARQGLAISGLSEFAHEEEGVGRQLPERDALVVNYAAPSDSAWGGALDTLCGVLP